MQIDDRYLTSVTDAFGINPLRPWLGTDIVNVAALFSMNSAMFSLVTDYYFYSAHQTLVHRLVHYRDMISGLYNEMGRYMRIQTLLQYHNIFRDIRVKLNKLANSADGNARRVEIDAVSTRLAIAILSMMAIYGRPARFRIPAERGTKVISDLLADRWQVRHLINLERRVRHASKLWMRKLLAIFADESGTFENGFGPGSVWIRKIQPLLRTAISLLLLLPLGGSGTN
jgi:hypothetical protein